MMMASLLLCGSVLSAEPTVAPALVSLQVPYRLSPAKHVIVRARLNGRGPFHFVIDTGVPVPFVSTAVCKKLGLKADATGWTTVEHLEIEGGVTLDGVKVRGEDPFQIETLNTLKMADVDLDGLIGFSVLARFRIELDVTRDRMIWQPLAWEPPLPLRAPTAGPIPPGLQGLDAQLRKLGAARATATRPVPVPRGFLGVELEEREGSVFIKTVLADSPAAAGGLKVGDVVRRFQGRDLQSIDAMLRLAARCAVGATLTLTVDRAGQATELSIVLGEGI